MSSISRRVCVSRCSPPRGMAAPGSVTSTRSRSSCSPSSFAATTASRSASIASIDWRNSFRRLPTGPRSSGGRVAMPRRRCVSSALRPSRATRVSSSAARSEAPPMRSRASCSSRSRSSAIGRGVYRPVRDGRSVRRHRGDLRPLVRGGDGGRAVLPRRVRRRGRADRRDRRRHRPDRDPAGAGRPPRDRGRPVAPDAGAAGRAHGGGRRAPTAIEGVEADLARLAAPPAAPTA